MRRLTFTNSVGESIVFYRSPYFISSLTGIGEVETDVQGQRSPYQDGDTYTDTILRPRYPTLEGAINATNLIDIKAQRKQLLRVCNPKLGIGKLTLEMDGDLKEIPAVLDSVPTLPERGESPYQRFMIVWKCPDPYWRDPVEVSRTLMAFAGTFSFPLRFPLRFGMRGDSEVLTNEGDITTPVVITFQGPVEAPQLFNETTGEFIRVNINLRGGDILRIDTDDHAKRVEIYRGNTVIPAFGFLDRRSDLWKLRPGENVIRYSADRGRREGVVALSWYNKYVGV